MSESTAIESVLSESHIFPPPAEFANSAHIKKEEYERLYTEAAADPEAFWAACRRTELVPQMGHGSEVEEPHAQWFVGGKINISHNCLDRHLDTWRRNKAALIWEGEPGEQRTLTYQQLHTEVCRFANVLKKLGVKKGDRVALYMPLIPELAISMLACARIGATHSVVFGGFSSRCYRSHQRRRVQIGRDGGWRLAARQ